MKCSGVQKVRRLGIIVAGLSLLLTVMMGYQAYIFYHSPPPIVKAETPPGLRDTVIILAGFITVVPGLYITRQLYRWSTANTE